MFRWFTLVLSAVVYIASPVQAEDRQSKIMDNLTAVAVMGLNTCAWLNTNTNNEVTYQVLAWVNGFVSARANEDDGDRLRDWDPRYSITLFRDLRELCTSTPGQQLKVALEVIWAVTDRLGGEFSRPPLSHQ